mgnify:CR=1 FL=1
MRGVAERDARVPDAPVEVVAGHDDVGVVDRVAGGERGDRLVQASDLFLFEGADQIHVGSPEAIMSAP